IGCCRRTNSNPLFTGIRRREPSLLSACGRAAAYAAAAADPRSYLLRAVRLRRRGHRPCRGAQPGRRGYACSPKYAAPAPREPDNRQHFHSPYAALLSMVCLARARLTQFHFQLCNQLSDGLGKGPGTGTAAMFEDILPMADRVLVHRPPAPALRAGDRREEV